MKLSEIQRIQQLAGLKEFTDPQGQFNTATAPDDEDQPEKGYAVRVTGTFVPPGGTFAARDLWEALEKILPNDYPMADYQEQGTQDTPQKRVLKTVERQGSAIVKTGIVSRDVADTIASKFEQYRGMYNFPNGPSQIGAEVIELDN